LGNWSSITKAKALLFDFNDILIETVALNFDGNLLISQQGNAVAVVVAVGATDKPLISPQGNAVAVLQARARQARIAAPEWGQGIGVFSHVRARCATALPDTKKEGIVL